MQLVTPLIAPHKLNILVEEVLIQCVLAESHFEHAIDLLDDPMRRQSRVVWAHIHGFLAHTAMVSKLFSPPEPKSATAKMRGQALQDALGVTSASPIFDRNARNNIEHLDERLDAWIESASDSLLEIVLDDRDGLEFITRDSRKNIFIRRALILEGFVFITRGRKSTEETKLLDIFDEVQRIHGIANSYLQEDKSVQRVSPF